MKEIYELNFPLLPNMQVRALPHKNGAVRVVLAKTDGHSFSYEEAGFLSQVLLHAISSLATVEKERRCEHCGSTLHATPTMSSQLSLPVDLPAAPSTDATPTDEAAMQAFADAAFAQGGEMVDPQLVRLMNTKTGTACYYCHEPDPSEEHLAACRAKHPDGEPSAVAPKPIVITAKEEQESDEIDDVPPESIRQEARQ